MAICLLPSHLLDSATDTGARTLSSGLASHLIEEGEVFVRALTLLRDSLVGAHWLSILTLFGSDA